MSPRPDSSADNVVDDVPKRLWDNRRSRDLPTGRVLRAFARSYRVLIDVENAEDAREDASHNASPHGPPVDVAWRSSAPTAPRHAALADKEAN